MKLRHLILLFLILPAGTRPLSAGESETAAARDARMQWWRDARFGLFLHWGLYAVPAGEWKGETGYGEWIRTSAQIPLGVYEGFLGRFNPVRFDPDAWVKTAKEAGMKYIVITTKHHDGFCLFDTKQTKFSVMSTPFRRDVMKALAEACRKQGMKICWYYSIMDWHHGDYLPRREWETDRPDSTADFRRYFAYLKSEIRELLTAYGPIGVLWFDGEWESTWNTAYGRELYDYVRSLQTDIIVNNRVGAGRSGMQGFTKEGEFSGDFGTPEQEVPARGLPGVDWETCMTMNDHWGYNSHDANWKSSADLIRTLADIASKGGNFLLNVGPTSEGVFPAESVSRLQEIGAWMRTNGPSIYGTSASPFGSLPWGRCTTRRTADGTRLFLHVFRWPSDGTLVVPGLLSEPARAYLMADSLRGLTMGRREDALTVRLPRRPPDTTDAVVVLDIAGTPDINDPPLITAPETVFIDSLPVTLASERNNVEIRYTADGSPVTASSPRAGGLVVLARSSTVRARAFRGASAVSPEAAAQFTRVQPIPATAPSATVPGLSYSYYQGRWDTLPGFTQMVPVARGVLRNFETPRLRPEEYAFAFDGYVSVPAAGVYAFFTASDDGSRLFIDGTLIVDNDGLHGMTEKRGVAPLARGLHRIRVLYFNKTGGAGLEVSWKGPGFARCPVPDSALFTSR